MKTFLKILLAISLFLLDITYYYIIYYILKSLGLDIMNLSTSNKAFALLLIDLSFMLIMYLIFNKNINRDIKDFKNNFKNYFKIGFRYWIIGLILMIIFNIIIYSIYPQESANEQIVQSALTSYPIYMVFSTILYAPFVEELIFRKAIRNIFNNKYNIIYVITSGFIFGFIHTLADYGNVMELLYILPYGIVGCMFAYAYTKTDNIFVTITFHLIHNALIVAISLLPRLI